MNVVNEICGSLALVVKERVVADEQEKIGQDWLYRGGRSVVRVFNFALVYWQQRRGNVRGALGAFNSELWNSCIGEHLQWQIAICSFLA